MLSYLSDFYGASPCPVHRSFDAKAGEVFSMEVAEEACAQPSDGGPDGLHGVVVVVRLHGEVDLANVHLLHDKLKAVVDNHSNAVLVLDLASLSFIDCVGLGALVRANRAMHDRGAELVLRWPTRWVFRLLRLTNLHEAFVVVQTPDDLAPS